MCEQSKSQAPGQWQKLLLRWGLAGWPHLHSTHSFFWVTLHFSVASSLLGNHHPKRSSPLGLRMKKRNAVFQPAAAERGWLRGHCSLVTPSAQAARGCKLMGAEGGSGSCPCPTGSLGNGGHGDPPGQLPGGSGDSTSLLKWTCCLLTKPNSSGSVCMAWRPQALPCGA